MLFNSNNSNAEFLLWLTVAQLHFHQIKIAMRCTSGKHGCRKIKWDSGQPKSSQRGEKGILKRFRAFPAWDPVAMWWLVWPRVYRRHKEHENLMLTKGKGPSLETASSIALVALFSMELCSPRFFHDWLFMSLINCHFLSDVQSLLILMRYCILYSQLHLPFSNITYLFFMLITYKFSLPLECKLTKERDCHFFTNVSLGFRTLPGT